MEYQVQENCLTIFLPREVDHHSAEELRKNADALIERNHIKYGRNLWTVRELAQSWGVTAWSA